MKRSVKSLTLNDISLARLAEQGHAKAQYNLGVSYSKGIGVHQDIKEAAKWYRRAAEQGFDKAQYNLGVLYSKGIGVRQDFKEAAKWYRRAAIQGHAKAQYNLGVSYSKGIGVHQDIKEAAKWYRRAAIQGHAKAQLTLGYLYEYGEGVPQDSRKATKWYGMAAEQGNPDGQLNVGYQYEFAYGVSRDFKKAAKWYRMAAEQGHAKAQYSLGYMYECGDGVSQDFKKADKWYRMAAEQGDEEAQYKMEQFCDKDLEIAGASVEEGKLPLEASKHGEIKDQHRAELSRNDKLIDPNTPFPSIDKWVSDISQKFFRKAEQTKKVFMLRMGMLGSPPKTLEQIGEQIGITRERVRQIINKMKRLACHPIRRKRLQPLIIRALEIVDSKGGKIDNTTLVSLLLAHGAGGEMLKFATPFTDFLSSLREWENSGLKIGENGVVFTDRFDETFTAIAPVIEKIAGENADEIINVNLWSIDFETLKKMITTWFNVKHPNNKLLELSDTVIRAALSLRDSQVKKIDNRVYSYDLWSLRFKKLSNIVETILRNSRKAMHFSEVYSEIKKYRTDDSFSKNNVHATLDRLPSVLLWDRGTFIHKKNAIVPCSLIRKVEKWVNVKLEQNIPFVSVHGAFKEFQNLCIHEGISSEYALYSCLRVSGEHLFAFPHFPFIYLNRGVIERIPMPLIIEEFIKEAGGPVNMNEIREFAIEGINVKQFMLNQYIDRAPNIIRIKRGTYLHTDYLKIEEQKLSEILYYVRHVLSKEDHVSVKKIFNDQKINCKLMGINSPEALFSVLQLKASDRIHVQSYPQIRLMGGNDTARRGIAKEISLYISNKKAPCSIQELYEHYVERLGYNEQTIYWATYDDDIYHYLRGCVIHKDTIDLTEEKQEQIEMVARDIYKQSVKAGSCYGLIDTLIESDALPQLKNDVYWTQLLISDLLKCQNNFIVIGSRKNVFLPLPNEFGIQTFEDFLYEILKRDYNGAINLEILNEELADSDIIAKGVTKNMLDKSTKVTIVGHEIMLTELAHHA